MISDGKNTEIDNGDNPPPFYSPPPCYSPDPVIKNEYIVFTAVFGFAVAVVGVILISCIDQLKTGIGFKIACSAIISISGLLIVLAAAMSLVAVLSPVKDQDDPLPKPKTDNVGVELAESCDKEGIQGQKI